MDYVTTYLAVAAGILLGILAILVVNYLTRPKDTPVAVPAPVAVYVWIICGDCSGRQDRPVKTLLDRHGRCATCGGSSYILASDVRPPRAVVPANDSHVKDVLPFKRS